VKSVHCAANGASEHCNIQRSEGRSHKQESRDTDEHVEDGLVVGWLDGWMIECEGDEWIDAKEIVVRDSLRSNILLAAGTTTAQSYSRSVCRRHLCRYLRNIRMRR